MLGSPSEKSKKEKGKKDKAKKDAKKDVKPSGATETHSTGQKSPDKSTATPGKEAKETKVSFAASSGSQPTAETTEETTAQFAESAQPATKLPVSATSAMMWSTMNLKSRSPPKMKKLAERRHNEEDLKRKHRLAHRAGADLVSELMEAHTNAVNKSHELLRCETQVKRGPRGMLKFELLEARQLCAEAREALIPAEDMYVNVFGEEASVRESLASAENTSRQVEMLELRMEEDAQAQQRRWVDHAMLEMAQHREDYQALQEQQTELHSSIALAVQDKELAFEELKAAIQTETKAHEDLTLASAERRRFKHEERTEQKAADRAHRNLESAQSQSADAAAKENVFTCMIDALEANAEDAGKTAAAEVFEAQQLKQLLHTELNTVDQLEGECERLRREIRDLSRLNRSKLLEL